MTEQQAPEAIDLRGILLLLRRQLRLIVLTAFAILSLALVYLVTATPLYTARTLLIVDPAQRNLLESDPLRGGSPQADSAKIDSEVEILRSPATALGVVNSANLVNDKEFGPSLGFIGRMKAALGFGGDTRATPDELLQGVIQNLQDATNVKRLGLTYLIAVDVTSTDAERAARIANATADVYILNQVQDKIQSSLSARDVLQAQAEAGRAAVAASDAALDEFIEANLAELEADADNPRVAQIRSLLENERRTLVDRRAAVKAAEDSLRARSYEALAESLADEALKELLRQREEIRSQVESAAAGSDAEVDLKRELAQLDDRLDASAGRAVNSLRDSVAATGDQVANLQTELRTTLLQSDLSSESLSRIFELQQAAAIARSQYQAILARVGEVENQAAVQVADSRVVSQALPPTTKSAPNTRLILAMALVAGLGLGIGLAFLNEYYVGGIVSPLQLAQLAGAEVATVIPKVSDAASAKNSVSGVILNEPLSPYAESIRKLRAVIDQDLRRRSAQSGQAADPFSRYRKAPGKDNPGAVIMVTSSVPAEGKTTLSLALARVYAQTGVETILIDADLRKPSVANLIGERPEKGLLDYLSNPFEKDMTDKFRIQADPGSPLHLLLGSGRPKVPTDQLVSAPVFDMLIDMMRQKYNVVIIDTPPLLPVVDARYVAQHADVVVLPVLWASTSQSDLRASLAALRPAMNTQSSLHLVLSQIDQSAGRYSYSYGYGYTS